MLRTWLALASLVVAASAGACTRGVDTATEETSQPLSAPAASCTTDLPGPALTPGALEGDPRLAELLSSIDVSRAPNPTVFGGDNAISRAVASYMLGRVGTSVTHAEASDRGGLGRSVLAAAVNGSGGRLDLALLRHGLYRYYACETTMPRTLAELVARYGDYRAWDTFDIPCSRAKDGPRRMHENDELGVYVAETIADHSIRETEVIFSKLRPDGQLAFAVYTDEGALTNRSTFATGTGAVTIATPFACMTCHFDRTSGTYSVRMPAGMGAGCQHPPTQ